MKKSFQIESKKIEDTLNIGEKIGNLAETGQIILLSGELGTGKTVLAKGIALGLGIKRKDITSPTYTIINEYSGRLPLYHMDLYRLESEEELYDIGFEEYLDRQGLIVIEWPEIAYNLIPSDYILIEFEVEGDNKRKLNLKIEGKKAAKLGKGLLNYVNSRH
ncbi:MAG: tRNA (adenosine(37)-N6)-threonylcarbamoyltransferase complex ATPase subunit type 1 TsaE [Bacillota bacterium]